MSGGIQELWVYLSTTPLLGLTATLVVYQGSYWLYLKVGRSPLLNPVFVSVSVLSAILSATGLKYSDYFSGAQFIHFLLGPATVALAIPLFKHFDAVRESSLAILMSLVCGAITAATTAVAIAWVFGVSHETLLSIAPKSVTSPVAMGISEQIGGLPSLTAVFVILTGISGAVLGTWVLNALKLKDWRARGFAVGLAAHGIGTARAFQVNEVAGAFASLAMGLNALATAILIPLLVILFF